MFLIWTVATTWFLLIFDSAWFERPIKDHSIYSLQVLLPASLLEWLVVASWIIPLLFVMISALFTHRLQHRHGYSFVLRIFPNIASSGMGVFDWVQILLVLALAILGWTLQITAILLPATIIAIGMSLSKLEHS